MPRILAVDDDDGILYTLRTIGDMAGWKVTTCSSSREALGLVETGEFDVIVVDYHMPHLDGLELVKAIRAVSPDIPVVVLTVDDRMCLADRFREAGANDFAVKPIKASDFISRIRLHLSPGPGPAGQAPAQSGAASSEEQQLPKGFTRETMSIIVGALAEAASDDSHPSDGWLSAEGIASKLGIAYQTVWRYLEALEHEGKVQVKLDYGGRGRPGKRYRVIDK